MGWSQEQLLGFSLTDWLLSSGESVARKRQRQTDPDALTSTERLLYEFWIFDMEQQNGGVSQYFLNRPGPHWNSLLTLSRSTLPSFNSFAEMIDSMVRGAPNAHEAFHQTETDVDGLYSGIRILVLQELQTLVTQKS